MSSGAALRLIVPDRRFTMDIARRETVLADVLAANVIRARSPQPRDVVDYYCNYTEVDRDEAWRGLRPIDAGYETSRAALAISLARSAMEGAYQDVHCWVFTPASFVRLMHALARLGMIWLECKRVYATDEGDLDFFVHIEAADDMPAIIASWRDAQFELDAAMQERPFLPQDDLAAHRAVIGRQAQRIATLENQMRHNIALPGILYRLLRRLRR
jgi:hypothetical protein